MIPRSVGAVMGWMLALMAALPVAAASAVPIGESPPNDNIAQPFGPLFGGVAYTGQFEVVDDRDWLLFYAGASKQVQVRVTKVGAGCSAQIKASVRNPSGGTINSASLVASDTTSRFDFGTGPPGRFYVVLENDCAGDPYQVQVGPPGSIRTSAPAGDEPPVLAPRPTSEPNDSIAAAFGPLRSGVAYGGQFSAAGDRDWLVFYTKVAAETRVSVTKVGAGCSRDIEASVRDADGLRFESISVLERVNSDSSGDFVIPTAGPGRFYVSLANDCAGDPYQVRVGPPEAITVSSPLAAIAPMPNPLATGEPNDVPAQATRVLDATAYGAAIGAANDVDLFGFRVAAGRQVDVAVTKVGAGCGASLSSTVLRSAGGSPVSGARRVGSDEIGHHRFASKATAEYLLRITGTCPGDPYQVRVDPADRDNDGVADDDDRCPTLAGRAPSGCPPKVKPRAMTLLVSPRRDRSAPFRFRVRGSVLAPPSLPSPVACAGSVTIRLVARGRTVARSTAALRRTCAYSSAVTLGSRRALGGVRRLRVTATFTGNRVLRSASRVRSVLVG